MESDVRRPATLLIALALGSLGAIVDLVYVLVYRAAFGEGWILYLAGRSFFTLLYFFMFLLAYNGRRWVRVVYAVFFAVGVASILFRGEFIVFLEPWLFASTLLSLSCLWLWFLPQTSAWYSEAKSDGRVDT